ncbi:MAG: MFS transporter [Phenylobacterium sp.]|uniref:MFS transporter n=1 Tax=Phenylobacterium sp. TaxID=1871053 RepID=UPI0025DEA89A|nr:MFS transporter [Phenylobacterium sp.]MBI1198000.1 MFS transporter [Phenylobacterium sp.]
MTASEPRAMARGMLIGLIGFLTLVDLFAAQAILPTLAKMYAVAPSAMGVAVNASTIGMAAAGLVVALVSHRLPRRGGIWVSLALLAIPTALLAHAPDLATFTALRIVQGVFMSAAFTLTMAYLSEQNTGAATAGALAAYITGNVASNLAGRLVSSSVAAVAGVAVNFYVFAALNLAGAALVFLTLTGAPAMGVAMGEMRRSALARIAAHFGNRCLVASFGIGFCVLFAFLGTFTYVNFVLAAPPLSLKPMALGLVYFVFLPSMVTTPLAGAVASRFGPRPTFFASLGLAVAGLPLLLAGAIVPVIAGLTMVGVGTFFAQATATGFVGRAARTDRAAASGIYLASYYLGGLAGAAVLGQVYDRLGWPAAVAVVGISLIAAAGLAALLRPATAGAPSARMAIQAA